MKLLKNIKLNHFLKFTVMQNFNTTNFRVYAKFNGQKQFKPLDLEQGKQVNNLIRATIVNIENFEQIEKFLKLNKDLCEMQVRNLNNKIVYLFIH